MPTCNICGNNQKLTEMVLGFRYVCKDCWERMEITIDGEEVNKEMLMI